MTSIMKNDINYTASFPRDLFLRLLFFEGPVDQVTPGLVVRVARDHTQGLGIMQMDLIFIAKSPPHQEPSRQIESPIVFARPATDGQTSGEALVRGKRDDEQHVCW